IAHPGCGHAEQLSWAVVDQDDEGVGDRHGSGVLEPDAALLVPGGAASPGTPRRDLADAAVEEGAQVPGGRAVVEFVECRHENVEQGLVTEFCPALCRNGCGDRAANGDRGLPVERSRV